MSQPDHNGKPERTDPSAGQPESNLVPLPAGSKPRHPGQNHSEEGLDGPGLPPEVRRNGEPGWAGGLRKLYNSVVEEPLPDSFMDLLKKLDESDDD